MTNFSAFLAGIILTIIAFTSIFTYEPATATAEPEVRVTEKSWLCTEETDGVSVCTTPDTEFEVLRRYKRNEYVL